MSDSLSIYLEDHLAGALQAIELLETLAHGQEDTNLGNFLAGLLEEVKADRETLRQIARRLGSDSSNLKDATAWLTEKVTRAKLLHATRKELATFEALEVLVLGIEGKLALWRALSLVAPADDRLGDIDFGSLQQRAQTQRDQTEEQRLKFARMALLPVAA